MFFREAKIQDIDKMYAIRKGSGEQPSQGVAEPTPQDYQHLLKGTGKGWVCEVEGDLLGYALVDYQQGRVWTLTVCPGLEDQFISRMLHDMMTSWCFARGLPKLILSTTPNSRAEQFYCKAGWVKTSTETNGQVILELENNLPPLDL